MHGSHLHLALETPPPPPPPPGTDCLTGLIGADLISWALYRGGDGGAGADLGCTMRQ